MDCGREVHILRASKFLYKFNEENRRINKVDKKKDAKALLRDLAGMIAFRCSSVFLLCLSKFKL